jgi:hypothetical protein
MGYSLNAFDKRNRYLQKMNRSQEMIINTSDNNNNNHNNKKQQSEYEECDQFARQELLLLIEWISAYTAHLEQCVHAPAVMNVATSLSPCLSRSHLDRHCDYYSRVITQLVADYSRESRPGFQPVSNIVHRLWTVYYGNT